jgi:RNA polymerase sigma factor (sigma-70 family)
VSTAQDLPLACAEPAPAGAPALRLVPAVPLDFDDAVRRVRPRLHRYAVRRLGDSHEAEELVQEALLRAYTHRDQLVTEEDLSAWTTVVTGRLVIDRLRVRGRSTSVADVPEGNRAGRDTADVVVARDEARTALDALDAMPARQAALLWAREMEGHSYEELCLRFDMTEPAVRSVLTRARKALRKEYSLRGGTLPVGGLAVVAPWIAGLSWADRLRRAAGRITAPAALATVGITALGGLVLSPFGAQTAPTATFTPSQAIVASTLAGAVPAAAETSVTRTASATSPHATAGSGAGSASRKPHGVRRLTHRPLAPVEALPCTQADHETAVPVLPHPASVGTPYGVGFGGSHCASMSVVSVGKGLPASDVTGYDQVQVGSNDISCTQLDQLTSRAPGLVTCTQETQP